MMKLADELMHANKDAAAHAKAAAALFELQQHGLATTELLTALELSAKSAQIESGKRQPHCSSQFDLFRAEFSTVLTHMHAPFAQR